MSEENLPTHIPNNLTPMQQHAAEVERDRSLIQQTFFREGTRAQFELFLQVAKKVGLSPLNRQITPMIRKSKNQQGQWEPVMTIITNIDGFRVIAERSGKYQGQVGPFWCGEDGQWKEVWLGEQPPKAAKVGVLRSDFKEPLWAVARWDSYVQTYTKEGRINVSPTWAKMPDVMISKVAEAMALRKAFPQDLSGLYSNEEMDQAKEKVIEAEEIESERPKQLPPEHQPEKMNSSQSSQQTKPSQNGSAKDTGHSQKSPPASEEKQHAPIGPQSKGTASSETTSNAPSREQIRKAFAVPGTEKMNRAQLSSAILGVMQEAGWKVKRLEEACSFLFDSALNELTDDQMRELLNHVAEEAAAKKGKK